MKLYLVPGAAVALLCLSALGCAVEGGGGADTFPDKPLATLKTDAGRSVEVRTSPAQPPSRGESSVELTVIDDAKKPVDDLDPVADLWMPAMGHGASVDPETTAEGDGRYRLDRVDLFMPGRWDMHLTFSGKPDDLATAHFQIP